MRRAFLGLVLLVTAAACTPPGPAPDAGLPSPEVAARNFVTVIDRVEPVAERVCRAEAPRKNCDFQILVDRRPELPANAFQTQTADGRPLVIFTLALVADVRNQDELAFVLAHETAHHIAGHIPRSEAAAMRGAILMGAAAAMDGSDAAGIRQASDVGAALGARVYSQAFELEADALGTVIAWRAGFDPARGARYFERLPDPGNQFLGTHPPNAARTRVVTDTVARLGPR